MKKKHRNRWDAFDDDRIEEYWEEQGLLDDDPADQLDEDDLIGLEDDYELIEGPADDPSIRNLRPDRRR